MRVHFVFTIFSNYSGYAQTYRNMLKYMFISRLSICSANDETYVSSGRWQIISKRVVSTSGNWSDRVFNIISALAAQYRPTALAMAFISFAVAARNDQIKNFCCSCIAMLLLTRRFFVYISSQYTQFTIWYDDARQCIYTFMFYKSVYFSLSTVRLTWCLKKCTRRRTPEKYAHVQLRQALETKWSWCMAVDGLWALHTSVRS